MLQDINYTCKVSLPCEYVYISSRQRWFKHFCAYSIFEWFNLGMSSNMLFQILFACKWWGACWAVKRFIVHVNDVMFYQVPFNFKSIRTFTISKIIVIVRAVRIDVLCHLLSKFCGANVTYVRFFSCVYFVWYFLLFLNFPSLSFVKSSLSFILGSTVISWFT